MRCKPAPLAPAGPAGRRALPSRRRGADVKQDLAACSLLLWLLALLPVTTMLVPAAQAAAPDISSSLSDALAAGGQVLQGGRYVFGAPADQTAATLSGMRTVRGQGGSSAGGDRKSVV